MQQQLVDYDYIIRYHDPVSEVAGEYLSRKGQTLDDYIDYIKQPGNKGDELALHIMACMANIATIVVTTTGVWSTFDGDFSDVELVLVYPRKSTFQDMVPIPPTKPKPEPPHKDVYKHEDGAKHPTRYITRSMGKTTPPSSHHPSQPSLSKNVLSQKVLKGNQELKL